jgi:DNA repair exonuclease SbcCD ATPase subunit
MAALTDALLDRSLLTPALAGAVGRAPLLPQAISREMEELLARPPRQRTKLWEFGADLHCSIIGTCLTTAELRQVFLKLGRKEAASATEHDIHASAVLLAATHHDGAKLLQKALNRRHRIAISRFDKAKTVDDVRAQWREASARGDIPGAYWAALTHRARDEALVREIFAEVHMLSHFVGAANRPDIRSLRQLEDEKAELEAHLARKQQQLQETAEARDRALRALEARTETLPEPAVLRAAFDDGAMDELRMRLARCDAHGERIEQQLAEAQAALADQRDARTAAEARRCSANST